MKPFKLKHQKPEEIIRDAIIKMLKLEGWHVVIIHGNAYTSGMPDLFACHRRYGTRWIEVKNPVAYSFTNAQRANFPLMVANGCGVYILVGATKEEYDKLFKPCNYYFYLNIMK